MKTRNIVLVTLILAVVGTLLSACGPSAEELYLEKITTLGNAYNAKLEELNSATNSGDFADPDVQAKILTALDGLDSAAADLAGIPAGEVPEAYQTLDGYFDDLANETYNMTDTVRGAFEAINAGDVEAATAKVDEFTTAMQNILAVLDQISAELDE